MQFKKKRSITLNVDKQGYITIDQAIAQTDRTFLELMKLRRKRK